MKSCMQYITGLLIVVTLAGCVFRETKPTPSLADTNTFTSNLIPLDSMPKGLTEILALKPTWRSGSVWAVQYSIEKNAVFSAYGEDGRIVQWSLDTENIVITHKLGIVSPKSLRFSEDGKVTLGSTGLVYKESEYTGHPIEHITGIAVWSTETGELIRCLSLPCFESPPESTEGEVGAVVDPTGQQVFIYSEHSISILGLAGDLPSQGIFVNSPDSDYWWNIGQVAYDDLNQRYAIIYQEGRVQIKDVIPNNVGPFSFSTILTEGKKGELSNIPAAVFDPSGTWLAFIRGDRLAIWEIEQNLGKLFFDDEIYTAFSLLFDQTGKFLFVAARDKITVLDIAQKNVVAEYYTPTITTFDISKDNRLLIWGDENGIIHVLGIPISK